MQDLSGLVVVVTGGNSGIGQAIAEGVGRAGASVAIWARNAERSASTVTALEDAGINAAAIACDTSDPEQVEAAMATTLARFGKVDVLFANAGIAVIEPLVSMSLETWQHVMRTNLDGSFLCTQAVARHLVERGEGGSIVIVSSTVSHYGGIGQAAYATSKTGLLGLGRTAAVELARHRVRCNILVPGWTETPMNESLRENEKFVKATLVRTPARRWATPSEFHDIAAFLADPSLTYHTGNEVVVDGGYTIF
ncbi:unannotated protein [freshwater metagenome]|uniref:Unannotated protein n=1 Tax=freshwater metagenome TaxID=449393 RepID=A0A6J7RE88_9ZZZZ|nr:SDR family oxidoreductase [Actinomycetota bacterium]MSW36195.1 SDR family oxidoreductase [Actinomycetota bacterium]MSX37891.1 SDR family oxidoreductase [Actinomycetota bacterium]